MKILLTLSVSAAAVLSLSSCGTVAPVAPDSAGTTTGAAVGKTYTKVLVQDFRDIAQGDETGTAGAKFAGIIAGEIMRAKPTASVVRTGKPDASTLVIGGDITRYVEGNAALRLLVGMGAGSSYFDAIIRVTDGGTGGVVSTLKADKNSWGLGGSIAASQTVETFMNEAAKKTAAQVSPLVK